jgi:hypothetical protein
LVDPNQVTNRIEDGFCPCRGCTAARKTIIKAVMSFIDDSNDLDDMILKLNNYKERHKL